MQRAFRGRTWARACTWGFLRTCAGLLKVRCHRASRTLRDDPVFDVAASINDISHLFCSFLGICLNCLLNVCFSASTAVAIKVKAEVRSSDEVGEMGMKSSNLLFAPKGL